MFFDLHKQGLIESTSIDIEKSDQITNVLDSIVIKLEGGTDFDLKCLETTSIEESRAAERSAEQKEAEESKMDVVKEDGEIDTQDDLIREEEDTKEESKEGTKEEDVKDESRDQPKEEPKEEASEEMKDEAKSQESKTDEQPAADESFNTLENEIREEEKLMQENTEIKNEDKGEESGEIAEQLETDLRSPKEEGEQTEEESSLNETVIERKTDMPIDEEMKNEEMKDEENKGELNESAKNDSLPEESSLAAETTAPPAKEHTQIVVPRPLHRTLSIFLRYLPANVTCAELETMFNAYPGFLRIALADPTFDKRFQRRGWITFDRSVDIRKVYLSVSSQRIRDCEIGAIINRDLSRRIRSVNGIASHRLNVLADLKHTVRIILNLDEEKAIWDQTKVDESADQATRDLNLAALAEPITVFEQQTRNPLLIDVEECFKERTGEEMDDTGEICEEEPENEEEPKPLERDEKLICVLDKLVFYLRVVHSLDYYNHVDYPNEDEMPNRIGECFDSSI